MLRSRCWLGAVALLMVVSVASAQERPRGGRGGFGRGGFGGGPLGLLRMPEVQKELNLSEDQKKEVQEVAEQAASGFNFQEFQNLSEEEREKRMAEMRKKGEEAQAKVNKILKPEQQARLKQLTVQRQGVMALLQPDVAKDLGLSDEQQEKLREIQASTRPQGGQRNFQDLSEEEREKRFTEMRERQEKAQTEMLAVLSADQKAKLEKMKGKEFEFPAFGGRPGGGERRRPQTKQE